MIETKMWQFIDKSEWLRGPWDDEPDKKQWEDAATGLPCLIRRGPSGALCGYVGLPKSHPLFGIGYSQCLLKDCGDEFCYGHSPEAKFEVHGGLTYAALCDDIDPEYGICHVAEEEAWWFGFDCAHAGDLCPSYERRWQNLGLSDWDEIYKDVKYVEEECASLARQLADYST